MKTGHQVRIATSADADVIGLMLHAFNVEYDQPTPPPQQISARLKTLLTGGDTVVLLADDPHVPDNSAGPAGLALLRFRASLWSEGLECYLAELYVKPTLRGHGLGRALMNAAMDAAREHGADFMDLSTTEDDVAARKLYESCGFTRQEGPGGPIMFTYEREL